MQRKLADAREAAREWYARESATANYDVFIRLPALLFFSGIIWLQLRAISDVWLYADAWSATAVCALAARGAALATMLTFAGLTLVRSRPVARAAGVAPRLVAVAGASALFAFVLLERAEPSPPWDVASAVLIMIGNLLALAVVLKLGRSFSTMAEARKLVTGGAYGIVRHPLYVAEEIAVIGMLLQYRSAASLVILAGQIGLQVWRMRYEEEVLCRMFPDYREYADRTPRLIPGVY